jgi:butyryl-CoA dehydrogenase
MNFELSEHHLVLMRMVRDFAQREIAPVAQKLDETGEFPFEIVRKMGELGLLGLPFPEEYGGSAADTLSYVIALEEIARVDCSVALTMAADVTLGGYPLYHFGTEEQKRQWLVPLAQGKILGAFGLTEPGAGSDAGATATTAILQDDRWIINGTKCFITNAGTEISGFVTITAVTGQRADGKKEISNIIVPRGTPGYTQSPPYKKLGLRASDTRELSFVDCAVPRGNLLGERGAGLRQFLQTLDEGRIGIAALGVGLAQGCLDLSLSYARERIQFGQPLFEFQAIQFKLADIAVNVELARLISYKAAALKDAGKPHTKESAMAKLFSSEIAVRAAEEAVQIHGGYGYMDDCPASRYYRDAKLLTIGEGTSEIQRLVIARHLGT